jgi:DNA-binding transcriptional MerR regulator
MLGFIDGAQRLGFSLREIREGLSEAAPNFPSRGAMIKALRSRLENIDQHLKEVQARRRDCEAAGGNGRLTASKASRSEARVRQR